MLEVDVGRSGLVAGEERGQRARIVDEVNDRDHAEDDAEDHGGPDQLGSLGHLASSAEREADREDGAHDAAVDGERSQAVGLEEAEQELHREVGGDRRAEGADQRLPANVVALRAEQVGQLRTPAAPMIGVASRKAKRAASSLESPASRPPPMLAPERDSPGISARACAAPIPIAFLKVRLREITSSDWSPCSERTGARRRRASAPNSMSPLTNRKIAAVSVDANRLRNGCSSSSPSRPAGIVPTTSSQPSFA